MKLQCKQNECSSSPCGGWVRICVTLLCLVLPLFSWAQEYNPEDPPEPYTMYKVVVTANPYGYTSGSGTYLLGDVVYISTSSYDMDYTFSHWNKNGSYYSDEPYFEYTVTNEKAYFEAIYEYTPSDPSEPMASNEYRLYLTNNIPEACSFNMTSGQKVEADQYVYLCAYPSMDYDFLGWYEGSKLVNSELEFNYLMGFSNATLTAKFVYNPSNPDEPYSMGGDISNYLLGDVDGDGTIDAADVILLINHYIADTTGELVLDRCDMNTDGMIDAADIILVINKYLQK